MSDHLENKPEECVSRKPWSEVLSRSAKLFVHGAASEGGRSFGKALFFLIAGLILIGIASFVVNSFTGWFSGFFDFWPFSNAVHEPGTGGWFRTTGTQEPGNPEKWYCRFNPLC